MPLIQVQTCFSEEHTVKPALTPDYQLGNWLVMLSRPQYWQLRDHLTLSVSAR